MPGSINRLSSPLWAVTCLYGTSSHARRLTNYRAFRRALSVPLVTVELSFHAGTVLSAGDADEIVQITAGDVMWQKERLLNIALTRLPATCRYVAWLDADVAFARADWAEATCRLLDEYPVAQLFDRALDGRRNDTCEAITPSNAQGTPRSLANRWQAGDLGDRLSVREGTRLERDCASGMAWAARRELLDEYGLYDACIAGAGDRALGAAMTGRYDDASHALRMTDAFKTHYLRWAQPFHAAVRGRVGCLPGDIKHLWHGPPAQRNHMQRHVVMAEEQYDPERDVTVAQDGSWRFASDKPRLREFFHAYFEMRRDQEQ